MPRWAVVCRLLPVCGLMTASLAPGDWDPAVNMGAVVNSPLTEKASYITADGSMLYFSHNSPQGDINIYYSQWDGQTWGTPVDLGVPVNSPGNDWGPTLTPDGDKLYFASDRPGGYGSYDIYAAERIGGVWQPPVNLGPIVNSSGGELGQDISADDSVLWFSRGWPEGSPTGEDIYYSVKVAGQWTTPVKWEWDTDYLEDNPNISADGNKLYFTAIYDTLYGGGYGSFDLWVSEKVNGVWQQPVNLGPNINTADHDANPSISSDGNTLYFTSKRPGGYGHFDLYTATQNPCAGTNSVPALVTVQTSGPEQFIIRVIDQALLDQMIAICEGVSPQMIVSGALLAGSAGYNRDPLNGNDWSWRLDENTIVLAEVAIELCDGIPSMVEADLQYWLETVGYFCPWSSQIVAIGPDLLIPGDIDGDGDVDFTDLAALLASYGLCDPDPNYNAAADFDNSGCVGFEDLAVLLANYGHGT